MAKPAPTPEPAKPDKSKPPEGDELGESGIKALLAEREARQDAEKRAKAGESAAAENETLKAQLAEIEAANLSDAEKAVAEARAEGYEAGKAEFEGALTREKLKASVATAAAGKLTDPADAMSFLDIDALKDADAAAVTKAIDELIEAKPYLALEGKPPAKRPAGDPNAGPRPEAEATELDDASQDDVHKLLEQAGVF